MFSSTIIDVPRPFIDPISSLLEALSVTSLAIQRPRRNNCVVLALDNHLRGIHLFSTSALGRSALHRIISECSTISSVSGVVIVSYRTSSPMRSSDTQLLTDSNFMLAAAGLQLIDWVVVGAGGIYCPRTLCEVPDPWPYGSTCV